jgi:hypothetical protein
VAGARVLAMFCRHGAARTQWLLRVQAVSQCTLKLPESFFFKKINPLQMA